MNGIPLVIKATPKSKRPKGLPKRTGKRKDTKDARYRAIQAHKAARREANEARAAANREKRAAGIPTAWEISKAKRYAKRHP